MQRNIYIAYALWFFSAPLGGGLHRIYCGNFFSGILQIGIYWAGYITLILIIGWFFWIIWGIWWLLDAYFTQRLVIEINQVVDLEKDMQEAAKLRKIQDLYKLYKEGAISEAEYQAKKEILMR